MADRRPHVRKWGLTTLVVITAFVLTAAVAQAGGKTLTTTLTGAAEIPGPGDPDGSGEATVRLNSGRGEICYELSVTGIAPAFAAHIHVGAVTEAGPVVVPLVPPTEGSSSACTSVDPALIKAIMKNPQQYYVNVHNAEYPAGALRGQLSK